MPSFNDVFSQITGGRGLPGNVQANRAGAFNSIAASFHPGQFAQVNAQIAAKNPSSYGDVPSLNQALHAGQINRQQWNQQFKVIQTKQNTKPIGGYTLTDALHNAVHQGANIALATPRAAISTGQQLGKQFQYLSGPTATQQQRSSIIQNQQKAATASPKTQDLFKQAPAQAKVQAAQLLSQGHKESAVQTYLNKQVALGNQQTMTGLSNALVLGSVNVGGGGLLGKALGVAKTAAGKDAAVTAAIGAQRFASAAQQADRAASVGKGVVAEAKTTRVPVVGPTESAAARTSLGSTAINNADRTSIPVTGKSTQVIGKATTVGDTAYARQSQQLSRAYDKEVAALKDQPQVTQKVMQPVIDKRYQAMQQKLDESAGKTSFAFNSKPKSVPVEPTAPSEAAKTISVTRASGEVAPQLTSKVAPQPVVDGTKVSGSALRTEQSAVQAGMKSEIPDKATFDTVSHKQEAANAVDLLHNDPQKAMQIAMGEKAGNNASHEAATYHAVANDALQQAKKTGDYSVVSQLASSPRHTGVSEAAQKLGAEGYNINPHDPIKLMNDVSKTREAAIAKRTGSTVDKETVNIGKQVKSNSLKVSRQDWHSFVESLKC